MFSVRIIIVNYRTADLVVDCLRSLADEASAIPNCRVVVVEGGSGDDSAARLEAAIRREGWGDWVELIPLKDNRGFAAGNNAAIRPMLDKAQPPDFLLLLNPDTLVRPGAVRNLVDFMVAHPEVGIVGSRLEDPDGTPQRSAFRFHGIASEFAGAIRLRLVHRLFRHRELAPHVQDECHRTEWVSGASLMIRREVFESVGLLDENYFLYFEETDLCLRAHRAGWQCWYVPTSRVVHLVGQSSGVMNGKQPLKRIPDYWFKSRRRYFHKNHGAIYAWLTNAAWLCGYILWRIRARIMGKADRAPDCFLRDFVRYNFLRPYVDRTKAD